MLMHLVVGECIGRDRRCDQNVPSWFDSRSKQRDAVDGEACGGDRFGQGAARQRTLAGGA